MRPGIKTPSSETSLRVRHVQSISCKILEGKCLTNEKSVKGTFDTYCTVQVVAHGATINNSRIHRTATIPNTTSPFYAETLNFEAREIPEDFNGRLYICVWRDTTNSTNKANEDKNIGYISLPALYIKDNLFDEEQWFSLLPHRSPPPSVIDLLNASLALTPPRDGDRVGSPAPATPTTSASSYGIEKERGELERTMSISGKKPGIAGASPTKVMDGELRIKIAHFAVIRNSHTISVGVISARSLKTKDGCAPEAYVVLHMLPDPEAQTTQITQVMKRTSPVWNETFLFALSALDSAYAVHFSVWDAFDDELIGQASIALGGIQPETKLDEWLPLLPAPSWWTSPTGKGEKKKKRDSISNTLYSFNLGAFANPNTPFSSPISAQSAISNPQSPNGTTNTISLPNGTVTAWKGKAFVQGLQSVCVEAAKTKRPHKLLDTKFRSISFCTHCGDAMRAGAVHLQCANCKISCHVQCGKLTSNNCGGIPTLRIKLKFSELPVLPMKKYESLAELLMENSYTLPRLLGQASTEREAAAQCLVTIMSSRGTAVDFINEMVSSEVACAESITTLFRANSLASKVVDVYMKFAALPYLNIILGDIVKQIFSRKLSCEVDPSKLEKGEDLKKNFSNLAGYAKQIVDIIFKSKDSLPETLKVIFHNVQEQVERKFPREPLARYTSVAGFIFLRFFAPALLGPKLFGLSDENGDARAQRTFTLLAKILQKLANLVEFNQKEAYLEICNPFVMGRMDSMRQYIDEISTPTGKPVTPAVDLPESEVAEECAKLSGLFERCNAKIVEIAKPSEVLLVKKLTFLLSEYGKMIANPESMSASESVPTTDVPEYIPMVKRDPSRRSLMKRSAAEVLQEVEESAKEAKVCTAIPNTQTIIEESVQITSTRHKVDLANMANAAIVERGKLKKAGLSEDNPVQPAKENPLSPNRGSTPTLPLDSPTIAPIAAKGAPDLTKSGYVPALLSRKDSPRRSSSSVDILVPTYENIRSARSCLKPLSEDEAAVKADVADNGKIDFVELRKKLRDHSLPNVNALPPPSSDVVPDATANLTQRRLSRLARGKHPPSIVTGAPDTNNRDNAKELESPVRQINDSLEGVKLKSVSSAFRSQSADMLTFKSPQSVTESDSEAEGLAARRGVSLLSLPPAPPSKPASPSEEKPHSASAFTPVESDETSVKTPLTVNQANILSQLQNAIGLISSNGLIASTTSKLGNTCAGCDGQLGTTQEQVKFAERMWHPNCIRCCICNTILPPSRVLYSSGSMYCENDFAQYVQPPVKIPDCAVCCRPISSGLVVQGLNKTFHSDCFNCHACAVPLRGTYIPIDGKPYCRPDFFKLMGLMCGVCGECIEAEYVEIGGRKYHQHCKTCIQCGGSLAGKQYFTVNGDAYCASHRDQIVNCRACGQVINGPVLTALKRQSQYHVEHFCCASCGTNLAEVPFYEKDDQPYCRLCHMQST